MTHPNGGVGSYMPPQKLHSRIEIPTIFTAGGGRPAASSNGLTSRLRAVSASLRAYPESNGAPLRAVAPVDRSTSVELASLSG
jgi:hypothetical protein